ncbi:peptidylprolyl isomerase, partial [Candidatus Bathyarchaeota archaeon]
LDEALQNLELEKTSEIEIPPEKAFGPRDPEKVRLVPLRRLVAKGITPQIGAQIEFNGKPATVRTIGGGRVQLDFNPPLAGKTLVYEITVKKKIEDPKEKVLALVHRRIPPVEIEKFKLKMKEALIELEIPEEAFYIEGIQLAKRGIAMDIQKFFPEIQTVRFIETYQRKPAEA